MDHFARFFLSFSHPTILIPLFLIGLIWIDRRVFYYALNLIFISIIVNFALKSTFQIPLSPALGKTGFAFPSGHMQFSVVLYTWLALHFKNSFFRVLIILLLIGMGWGLHYFGYHSYFDIFGAILVGGILVFLYYVIYLKKRIILPWLVLVISSSLIAYIYIHYGFIPDYVSRVYYILLGMVLSEICIKNNI